MDEQTLTALLRQVRDGGMQIPEAVDRLRRLEVEVLASARLDHHRALRTGLPEAVFGENKSSDQLVEILAALLRTDSVVLATRVDADKGSAPDWPDSPTTPLPGFLTGNDRHIPVGRATGTVVIVTAGTSDLPVAEEARITLHMFGHPVETVYDAGVAGIHRILAHSALLQQARVIIVVAGMEGALPSVVAGMTGAPVIAVPTSVGYGAGAGGWSALLGMLNSCSPGLAVVNIDNGFGAACMAAAINRAA
jgi:NCAIR mutase (PurE)-related protein